MACDIKKNLEEVISQIREAELKAGRKEGSVSLVAVSKFHPEEDVLEALNAGQFLFGENRVQEAFGKFTSVREKLSDKKDLVHLQIIGNLQSNKVKKACMIADTISSVDRLSILKEIDKQCGLLGKKIDVLFELHTGEESKSGFEDEKSLFEALSLCADGTFQNVNAKGLMTMAPFSQDEKLVRKSFVTLRNTLENANKEFPSLKLTELSMGMSGDFKIAIEEGSTQVRVGTAIFGERDYSKA